LTGASIALQSNSAFARPLRRQRQNGSSQPLLAVSNMIFSLVPSGKQV